MALTKVPRTTHQWLKPLYDALDVIVNFINVLAGANWKAARLATAGALPAFTYNATTKRITFDAAGSQTVDGVATVLNDRVLVKDEAGGTKKRNGIYFVQTKGTGLVAEVWERASDAFVSADFTDGKQIAVAEGTLAGTAWLFTTNAPFTLDTTDVQFDREANVMLTDKAQTVSALKRFNTLMLGVFNGAGTFLTKFATNATVDRVVTFPNADATMAQAGVATGGTAPGFTDPGHDHGAATGGTAPGFTDPGHDHGAATGAAGTGATGSTAPGLTDPTHDHGGATGAEGTGATGSTAPGLTDPTHDHGGATGGQTVAVTENNPDPRSMKFVNPAAAAGPLFAQQAADFDIGADTGAGVTQPDADRNVQVVFSAAWDGGNVRLSGLRMDGTYATEDVVANPGNTVQSAHAYEFVGRARNLGVRTAGTVDVQYGPKLGVIKGALLPALLEVFEMGSGAVAGATLSANGVVDLNATPPDGARDFVVVYTLANAYAGASHTHTVAAGATGATVDGHTHTGPSHTHPVAAGATGATVDGHTHTGPSHTHSIASDTTGASVDSHTHPIASDTTGASVDSHTHAQV